MLILGIGNKARNGKDTAAEAIRDHYESRNTLIRNHMGTTSKIVNVGIFKYATSLYAEVENLIGVHGLERVFSGRFKLPIPSPGLTMPFLEGVVPDMETITIPSWVTMGDPTPVPMAKYGKHPKLLQWWGTEYRRTYFGADYWADRLFASIPVNLDIAMISDTRLPNEADRVKQRGGYTVNVQRLREDGTQYYSSDRPVDHPSEIALDGYNWDFYLKAKSGEQVWLQEQAITLAEYLRGLHS